MKLSLVAALAILFLSPAAFANVDAFPSFLRFNDTAVGQRSSPQQVTVTNRGPQAVSSVSVSGICNGFDVQPGTCLGPLNNGQSCYFQVAFNPRYEGSASCTVNVRAGSSFDSVTANGRGVRKVFPEPADAVSVMGLIPPDKDMPCTGGSAPSAKCPADDPRRGDDHGGGSGGDGGGKNDDDNGRDNNNSGGDGNPIEPK